MAPETVFEHLTRVLAQENLPAEPLALRMLARAARGSMRDALSLTDQAIAFGNGQLQEDTVRQMLGSVDRGHVLRLLDALDRSDGAEIVSLIDAMRRHGLSAASALEDMSLVLQHMAVIQAVPNSVEDESDPDSAQITRLAKGMAADETQLLYSLCLHGRGELGLAPDEYVALTMILLRLLAFKPGAMTHTPVEKKSPRTPLLLTPETQGAKTPAPLVPADPPVQPVFPPVLSRSVASQTSVQIGNASDSSPPWVELDEQKPDVAELSDDSETQLPPFQVLKVRESSEPTERTSHRREAAKGQDEVDLIPTPEGDFWNAVVRGMIDQELINALVRELALQSQLLARNSDRWHLKLERESLNQANSRERLKAALATLGHAVALDFEFGKVTDSPLLRHTVALREKQQAAQTLI
jgi:DNA polymerase-3 subunit gamma/tau